MDTQKVINNIYYKRHSIENMFDEFIKEASSFYELPVHSLQDMRDRENKKIRGDIFEEFCCLYLKHVLSKSCDFNFVVRFFSLLMFVPFS